jgi:hypothetical protein
MDLPEENRIRTITDPIRTSKVTTSITRVPSDTFLFPGSRTGFTSSYSPGNQTVPFSIAASKTVPNIIPARTSAPIRIMLFLRSAVLFLVIYVAPSESRFSFLFLFDPGSFCAWICCWTPGFLPV